MNRPKSILTRRLGYWWHDLRHRDRARVSVERRVLRALRTRHRWRDGYLAFSVTVLARMTGVPRGEVKRALAVLASRGLVHAYAHEGRSVYLPRGRVPTGVLRGDGRALTRA